MNYRHSFHAGNFADLVKHAALLQILPLLRRPLAVIDTHAGRGLYDLGGADSQRSGEAEAGIRKLMEASELPQAFKLLREAAERLNKGKSTRFYPGSPLLIADSLKAGDSYLACELRPEEHSALATAVKGKAGVKTVCADGFTVAADRVAGGSALVLIDPPFEKGDDYRRIAETLGVVARKNPAAVVMVWLPLKDLETFDAFLRDAEDADAGPLVVVEARMRPLTNPMKMNGCALVFANAPPALETALKEIAGWTVGALGEGGEARVWTAA